MKSTHTEAYVYSQICRQTPMWSHSGMHTQRLVPQETKLELKEKSERALDPSGGRTAETVHGLPSTALRGSPQLSLRGWPWLSEAWVFSLWYEFHLHYFVQWGSITTRKATETIPGHSSSARLIAPTLVTQLPLLPMGQKVDWGHTPGRLKGLAAIVPSLLSHLGAPHSFCLSIRSCPGTPQCIWGRNNRNRTSSSLPLWSIKISPMWVTEKRGLWFRNVTR